LTRHCRFREFRNIHRLCADGPGPSGAYAHHERLQDGRDLLDMTPFDEWPLATSISPERIQARHVACACIWPGRAW
jgi:hypothetical protein